MFVRVHCKKEGFRRAGRAWPAGLSLVEIETEAFDQLAADPVFEIRELSAAEFKAATRAEVDLSIDGDGKATKDGGGKAR